MCQKCLCWCMGDIFRTPHTSFLVVQYAAVTLDSAVDSGAYWGMSAYVSVWEMPDPITYHDDFTLSQMWLASELGPGERDVLEVGWHVSTWPIVGLSFSMVDKHKHEFSYKVAMSDQVLLM